MHERLTRIVYLSSPLIEGHDARHAGAPGAAFVAELDRILAASQRNNAAAGVTGALIFNSGLFGQVLEGPEEAVEATFLRIRADPRHGAVTMLGSKPVIERAFGDWSMGFVGLGALSDAPEHESRRTTFDLAEMDDDEVFAVLHGLAIERDIDLRAA